MNAGQANILILKTNINTETKMDLVASLFRHHPNILKWTLDSEDIDKVLRIEATTHLTEGDVINTLLERGLHGEVLEN